MINRISVALLLVLCGLLFLLTCGQPSQQASTPTPAARPAYLCVLCIDDKRIDILNLEQQGKLVKSISLPSTPGLLRVSPQAANLAITDDTGIIRISANDLDHPQQVTLGFAPTDIGFLTPQICLLSNPVSNQIMPIDIEKDKTISPLATPAGPANYAMKTNNYVDMIYLACTKARQLVEIDRRIQKILRTLNLSSTPGEMLIDEITKSAIYMTLPEEGKLIRINLTTFAVDATLDLVPGSRYLCADSTFTRLYISQPPAGTGKAGTIAVVKLPEFGKITPDPITDARLTDPGHLLVFDAILNSPVLYVCNPSSNYLAEVDLNSFKVMETIPTSKKPSWLGYLPVYGNK
jgi:hypothetical protein